MVKGVQTAIDQSMDIAWQIARQVPDPEIPVLTLGDLGIVRGIETKQDGTLLVKLSPTYSGCPAVQMIEDNVSAALKKEGFNCKIERTLSPPWTTDWISEEGREKLIAYGIAPPRVSSGKKPALFERDNPDCPKCKSGNTSLVSQFGSTPCKAHYQCANCHEPFDYFKCL